MKNLEFKRPAICGGVITFSKAEADDGDDVVAISTSDADGGRSWWVGLEKDQAMEVVRYILQAMREHEGPNND